MVIHSVTPLSLLQEQTPSRQTAFRRIDGGYLEGCECSDGFMTSRLISTDPALYLKNEYAPGSILPGKLH